MDHPCERVIQSSCEEQDDDLLEVRNIEVSSEVKQEVEESMKYQKKRLGVHS